MPYADHPLFVDPLNDSKLWRYIDLAKFESLLNRRALFFCRSDRFADPFEGASPEREVEHKVHAYREIMEMMGKPFDEEQARKNAAVLEWHQKALRQSVIVSCWHANDHESEAMWRLYLKDWFGVAVQSTVPRLKASLDVTSHEVYAGRVRYLDYGSGIYYDRDDFPVDGVNAMTPFIHKRRFFVHENEYRALVDLSKESNALAYDWSEGESENGKFVSVDLASLVERVVVPPQAEDDFVQQVTDLVAGAGLDVEVRRSNMSSTPRF